MRAAGPAARTGLGPRRLAVVSTMEAAPWGGSEELWRAVALRALDEGWRVLVSTTPWSPTPEPLSALAARGARLVPQPARTAVERHLPRIARNLRPTLAAVARFAPDVVLLSQGATYDLAWRPDVARDVARLLDRGTPVYALCNQIDDSDPPPSWQRGAAERALTRLTRVGFTSAAHQRRVERHLGRDLPSATVFQYPVRVHDPVPWPTDRALRLAHVGRLEVRDKGQDLLLEALASLGWPPDEWRLTLYGEGPDRELLGRLAERYGIAGNVRFAGHVEPARIWVDEQVLVLPSRREGLPLVLVGAMLAGRPVVATDLPGVAELVGNGDTGYLAAAASTHELRRALSSLWERRHDAEAMGAAARQRALAWRDPDPAGALLTELTSLARGTAERTTALEGAR